MMRYAVPRQTGIEPTRCRELFEAGDLQEPEEATDMDLDLLLSPSSSQPVPLSTKRRAQQAAVAAAAEPIAEWYYQLFGQEIGPATFDEVVEQIKNGSLEQSDLVRLGREGLWQTLDKTSPIATSMIAPPPPPPLLAEVCAPLPPPFPPRNGIVVGFAAHTAPPMPVGLG